MVRCPRRAVAAFLVATRAPRQALAAASSMDDIMLGYGRISDAECAPAGEPDRDVSLLRQSSTVILLTASQ